MDDRTKRAKARRGRIVISRRRLGEPDNEIIDGPEAVGLVHRLTLASWAWSGRPLPNLARSELPMRFLRGRRT